MSRITYNECNDLESLLAAGRWEAREKKVMNGRPALRSFRELEAALSALPRKRLIEGEACDGLDVCAVGALALYRRVQAGEHRGVVIADLTWEYGLEERSTVSLGELQGLTNTLSWIIVERNDERYWNMTPEERYDGVLTWVRENIARLEAQHAAT